MSTVNSGCITQYAQLLKLLIVAKGDKSGQINADNSYKKRKHQKYKTNDI